MVLVFSYGSNSGPQLRARVKNPRLESRKAILDGYARVFCLRAGGWGGGGVASLCPCPDHHTCGSVVELNGREKALLDTFEDGYREVLVDVRVFCSNAADEDEKTERAVAYVAGEEEDAFFTPPMTFPPSEPYLAAIHIMLAQHGWDASVVEVRTSAKPEAIVARWTHPGLHALTSLEALAVHLNAHLPRNWEMPLAAFQFGDAARRLWDVYDVQGLADELLRRDDDRDDNSSFLPDTELDVLKDKMRIQLVFPPDKEENSDAGGLSATPVVFLGQRLLAVSTKTLLSYTHRRKKKVGHDRFAWII